MRVTTIPDAELWPGASRIIMNPPDGDLTNDEIRALEMVAELVRGRPAYSARCILEDGDLETLRDGGAVWVTFYGSVPPFSVTVAAAVTDMSSDERPPSPAEVLACPMDDNDAGAGTIRTYLVALLAELWMHGECFSGKRPFGNSGWQYELYGALVKRGYIRGEFDTDGYLDDVDSDAGRQLITAAIEHLSRPPTTQAPGVTPGD